MEAVLWKILVVFNVMVLAYFITLNLFYFITSISAYVALRRYFRRMKTLDIQELIATSGAPPITLLAPAYNEEATCVEATRSLLALNHPNFEVLVINDGSKDETMSRLKEAFDLEPFPRAPTASLKTKPVTAVYRSKSDPSLWVIDKENGGKADALNVGINFCETPLFCGIDADSLLEPDALMRIQRVFLENGLTIAAGGSIRIANGCTIEKGSVRDVRLPRNLLASFQVLEYLRAFLAGRLGWSELNATLIISGAFGVFRRSVVVDAGGYASDTVGEDMELIVRLHRHMRRKRVPYRIEFVPDPVAWTEVPESLKTLGRQRDRWHRGLWDSLMRHRGMMFNPRYGMVGMVAFPYFFFLELLGPLVEILGFIAFAITILIGRASSTYIIAFLAVAIVLGIGLSVLAVGLEEISFRRYTRFRELFRLFLIAIIENFGYRQIVSFFRMKGLFSAIRGKQGWGAMQRRGFSVKGAKP